MSTLKELVVPKVDSGMMKHSGYSSDESDIQSRYSGLEHLDAPQEYGGQDFAKADLVFQFLYQFVYVDCSFGSRWPV